MFEKFTDRARRVVVLAQEEARRLNHNFIGTEHILLGVIAEGEGVAAKALEALDVSLDGTREAVLEVIGAGGPVELENHIPFTPRAKTVLEMSLREALGLGHNYIGTEHILLGLVREGGGVAAKILTAQGVTGDQVREAVVELLKGFASAETQPAESKVLRSSDKHTVALQVAITIAEAAAREAGHPRVGTHHVLDAFARLGESAAAEILAAGGFDASKLDRTMLEWNIAGTMDESEDQRAARTTELEVESDDILGRLVDPALKARIKRAIDDATIDVDQIKAEVGKAWLKISKLIDEATPDGPPQQAPEPPDQEE